MNARPDEEAVEKAPDILAREYELRGTDYCSDKARALRAGDSSGFVRTDIALEAIAAALTQQKDDRG